MFSFKSSSGYAALISGFIVSGIFLAVILPVLTKAQPLLALVMAPVLVIAAVLITFAVALEVDQRATAKRFN